MTRAEFTYVLWEDGEGRIHESVGWVISRDPDTVLLSADTEIVNATERVALATTEIPVTNIHVEYQIQSTPPAP